MDGDGVGLCVNVFDEIIIGRDEDGVVLVGQHLKEGVDGGIVDALDGTYGFTAVGIDELEAFYLGKTDVFRVIVGQTIREKDIAVGQFLCPFLRVDVAELHQGTIISMKPILLHEEWNEDAVNLQYEVIRLHAVKHVIIEEEIDLALDAVGAPDAADGVNF